MEFMCVDFLNSDWRDWRGSGRREDRLDSPEWWSSFCSRWDLDAPMPPDGEIRDALGELRAHMRSMIEAMAAGAPLAEQDLQALNRALEQLAVHPKLLVTRDAYRLQQVALTEGWPYVVGRIAESFAKLLAEEDVRRLKICDNEDCRWIYYDESRNRARRWCDDKACGNLIKVRRFRERQKEKGTTK